jgi:hypothetical protein
MECNTGKKEANTSTSQLCADLVKLTFYWLEQPKNSKLVAIEASFAQARPYKSGESYL